MHSLQLGGQVSNSTSCCSVDTPAPVARWLRRCSPKALCLLYDTAQKRQTYPNLSANSQRARVRVVLRELKREMLVDINIMAAE